MIDVAAVELVAGDARRERRRHELVGLAGAEVVEGPDPQDGEAPAQPGLEAEEVGRHLRCRVGAGRPQRRVLGERQLGLGRPCRTRRRWRPTAPARPRRRRPPKHVERALGVGAEGLDRRPPRATHVGPAGQVVDDLGPHRPRARPVDAASVMSITGRPAGRRSHATTSSPSALEVGDQVAADEAAAAGDQRPQRARTWRGGVTWGDGRRRRTNYRSRAVWAHACRCSCRRTTRPRTWSRSSRRSPPCSTSGRDLGDHRRRRRQHRRHPEGHERPAQRQRPLHPAAAQRRQVGRPEPRPRPRPGRVHRADGRRRPGRPRGAATLLHHLDTEDSTSSPVAGPSATTASSSATRRRSTTA